MNRILIGAGVLALFVSACGDDGGGGGGADASDGIDATPEPAACGIRIEADAFRAMGPFPVVFGDADGNLIEDMATDSEGLASRECTGDTTVSVVVELRPGSPGILSYMGVKPGQFVSIGVPRVDPADPNTTAQVTLSTVAEPVDATSFSWRVGGCSQSSASGATESRLVDPVCLGQTPETVDVIARAVDVGGNEVGFDYAVDVPVVPDGTMSVALDGWEPPAQVTYDVSNILPGTGVLEFRIGNYRDGIDIYFDGPTPVPLAGPTHSLTFPAPPAAFVEVLRYTVESEYNDGTQRSVIGATAPTTTVAVDFSTAPPRLAGPLVGLIDPTRPELTFLADGDGSGADVLLGSVSYGVVGGQGTWVVMRPASTSNVLRFPEMPSGFADALPSASLPVGGGRIELYNYDSHAYSDVIQDPKLQPIFGRLDSGLEAGQTASKSSSTTLGGP